MVVVIGEYFFYCCEFCLLCGGDEYVVCEFEYCE